MNTLILSFYSIYTYIIFIIQYIFCQYLLINPRIFFIYLFIGLRLIIIWMVMNISNISVVFSFINFFKVINIRKCFLLFL